MSAQEPAKKLNLLTSVPVGNKRELYSHVLFDEEVLLEFNASRDVFAITDKKIILVDVQGLTGKKKEVLIIPFSKITAFSTETAGTFDLDLEVKLWASGIGYVELSFTKGTDKFNELTMILAKNVK